MTPEQKAEIDGMEYIDLLRLWRFAPTGHELLQGEVGLYFNDVMREKRAALPDNGVAASKAVGWEVNTIINACA